MRHLREKFAWIVAATLGVLAIAVFAGVIEGGPLDPPGPPAPTDGVREAGTPIDALPFVSTQGGRYYLTRSLTTSGNGISIQAQGATLDLNGFELRQSGAPAGTAVSFSGVGVGQFEVYGGTIVGFATGIDLGVATGSWVHDVTIVGSTVLAVDMEDRSSLQRCRISVAAGTGISAADDTLVEDCVVGGTGTGSGIEGGDGVTVRDCEVGGFALSGIILGNRATVDGCDVHDVTLAGGFGIHGGKSSSISDCHVSDVLTGKGIDAQAYSVVEGCTVNNTGADGIDVEAGSLVSRCTVNFAGAIGIDAFEANVLNSTVRNSAGVGIDLGPFSAAIGNTVADSGDDGILASVGALILNNTARGAGADAAITDGAGIRLTDLSNHVEGNTLTQNDVGIASVGNNTIIRNAARQNATDFALQASDIAGPAINATTVDTATNPYANFDPP